ncbi:MAG: hypothetical protein M1138_00885 [Candidatus Thermoplasmatota archaeon]|nr:hypothetical protein [Candidatus Thermoplasmatota archaeon]
MTSRGTAAEGILLKMLLQSRIEAEHGSPSRPGDIIIPPNVIVEVKDPNASSYSFFQHSGKGEAQWKALKEKKDAFPWLEVFYAVRFNRKTWRVFHFPPEPRPLHVNEGIPLQDFIAVLLERQMHFAGTAVEGGMIQ